MWICICKYVNLFEIKQKPCEYVWLGFGEFIVFNVYFISNKFIYFTLKFTIKNKFVQFLKFKLNYINWDMRNIIFYVKNIYSKYHNWTIIKDRLKLSTSWIS